MKIVIPAAGLGSRMMPYTAHIPKAMLPVGQQTPITRLLAQLQANNATQIIIITGYQQQTLSAFVLNHFPNLDIQFVYNDCFAKANNIYSLFVAKRYCNGEITIINADLLLADELLNRILNSPPNFVVVDKDVALTETATKVVFKDGFYLSRISKDIDPASAQGENIGVIRLAKDATDMFFGKVTEFIERGNLQVWYPYALDELLGEISVKALFTNQLPWCEIDTPQDYEKAVNLFAESKLGEEKN